MKSFIEQAQFYAGAHQNKMTRYTHFVGVPLIILSLMIFFGFIKLSVPGLFVTDFALLGTIALMVYYFKLQWKLALALTPIMIFLLWIAHFFSYAGPTKLGVWIFLITFISGWALQFYGHYIEGRKPAFMDNICQAFIAPLFLVAELLFMVGLMPELKKQIEPQIITAETEETKKP